MRDALYDYPFAFVFLFLLFLSLSIFVSQLFFVCALLIAILSFLDKRVLILILVFSLSAFFFFKFFNQKQCAFHSKKVVGRVIDVRAGSRLSFLVKTDKGKLYLFAPARYDNIDIGDKVLFHAKVKPLESLKNNSFKRYLFSIGVCGIGFVRYARKIDKRDIVSYLQRLRKRIEEEFYYFLPSKVEYFLDSAFLGDSRYKSKIKDDFIDTQTAHILAVSGVHMGFVFGMFYFLFYELVSLCGFIYRRFNLKVVASILALIPTFAYFLISGMHIPAIRSFSMMLLFIVSVIFSLRRNSINALFFVGSIFLMVNLRSIFNPSFVMSFLMTLFAIVIYINLDGLKPQVRWIAFVVLLSIFAMPLSVYYFGKLSVFSFAYNASVVPLFGFVVVPVAFLLLAFSILPYGGLKVLLFKIGSFVIGKFLVFVSLLSKVSIVLRIHLDFLMVFVIYAVLISLFILLNRLLSHLNSQSQIR